jgi:multiple sugar transport system substrate-binding protein
MDDVRSERRSALSRRRFLRGALGAAAAAPTIARRAGAQAKPTITYWNGLTGADGKVMDELIDQFTKETGIKVEQQRIVWPDLYAKLQVSVPAGEGPDLCLIHTVEIPHFASDGILDPMDDGVVGGKGFKADDYIPSTWQGGIFQGKRYAIALDVPQHVFYMNVKLMKDAGLAGADGRPKVPASGAELLAMAKQLTKGDTFGFAVGSGANIGRYPWGFHHMLWQNGANVYAQDLKRSGLTDAAAIEAAEFWGGFHAQHKVAPPANANGRDVFVAGKLGMWLAGSWNVVAVREAKMEFAVAPMPRFLKQPVVWTIPHQYTLPKPKTADPAKRDAAWAHIRWMTDHVAEWTLKAGQVSAMRKAHSDPRITADPVLRTLLAQAPNWQLGQPTPKWVAAENLTRPVIESVYIGQRPPRAAMEDLARQIDALPT